MTEMPEITTETYHNTDERGAWEVVKIMVGNDFYIDVACREAPGSIKKAKAIAEQVQVALIQTMRAQYEQQQKDDKQNP